MSTTTLQSGYQGQASLGAHHEGRRSVGGNQVRPGYARSHLEKQRKVGPLLSDGALNPHPWPQSVSHFEPRYKVCSWLWGLLSVVRYPSPTPLTRPQPIPQPTARSLHRSLTQPLTHSTAHSLTPPFTHSLHRSLSQPLTHSTLARSLTHHDRNHRPRCISATKPRTYERRHCLGQEDQGRDARCRPQSRRIPVLDRRGCQAHVVGPAQGSRPRGLV